MQAGVKLIQVVRVIRVKREKGGVIRFEAVLGHVYTSESIIRANRLIQLVNRLVRTSRVTQAVRVVMIQDVRVVGVIRVI